MGIDAGSSGKTIAYSTPHIRSSRLGDVTMPVSEIPILLCTRPEELTPFPDLHLKPQSQYAFNPADPPSYNEPYFEFGIRPPATDIETWSRWIEMDHWLGTRHLSNAEQVEVLARYHEHLPDQKKEEYDLTIDDPAIGLLSTGQRSGKLFVELVPLLVEMSGAVSEHTLVDVPLSTLTNDGLPFVRAEPILCGIEIGDGSTGGSRLTHSGSNIKVRVNEREIWELRVYAAVLNSHFDDSSDAPGSQRFESWMGLDPTGGGHPTWTDPSSGTEWRLVSPRRLVLEGTFAKTLILGGQEDNPNLNSDLVVQQSHLSYNQQSLFNALKATHANRNLVEVNLEKSSPRKYRYLTKIELSRQLWRWRGRPLPGFPISQAKNNPDVFPSVGDTPENNLMLWDTAGFADRSRLDILHEVRQVSVHGNNSRLFEEDLTEDHRALYYRFSATAVGRYSGIYIGNRLSTTSLNRNPSHNKDATTWRRLFVPCRFDGVVPKPIVRFVIPLTQSKDDDSHVSGLLAVLDESWYSAGGIAEQFEAAIDQVENPLPASGNPWYYEIGPDPTIRGVGSPGTVTPSPQITLGTIGPIGHTFDTDTEVPRYVATSMMLSPPSDNSQLASNDDSYSWYFAHVKFRRTLQEVRKDGASGITYADLSSAWTEPRWIQFLPDSTSILSADETNDTYLAWSDDSGELRLEARSSSTDRLVHWNLRPSSGREGSEARFRYYLVVTEQIVDARGRPGHEKYLLTAEQDINPNMHWSFRAVHPIDFDVSRSAMQHSTQEIRIRILEVQYHDKDSGDFNSMDSNIWDLLFGLGDELDIASRHDAKGRIVRISHPTDHKLSEN